ncbi:hypothetical protein [Ureibacillus acetophenoni]
MFFIVNAIDFTATKDEEEDVKDYVRNELQRFKMNSLKFSVFQV